MPPCGRWALNCLCEVAPPQTVSAEEIIAIQFKCVLARKNISIPLHYNWCKITERK